MEFRVVTYFHHAYAHYNIVREYKGVYHADLIMYDGLPEHTPPATVLMLRGLGKWWGSADDKELIRSLGDAIDTLAEKNHFFIEDNKTSGTPDKAS